MCAPLQLFINSNNKQTQTLEELTEKPERKFVLRGSKQKKKEIILKIMRSVKTERIKHYTTINLVSIERIKKPKFQFVSMQKRWLNEPQPIQW